MTPERLAELRRLADAATPGPWAWEATSQQDNSWCVGTTDPPHEGEVVTDDDTVVVDWVAESGNAERLADAAFLAASRTAVPDLLDEVERLRAERDGYLTNAAAWSKSWQEAEAEKGRLRAALESYERVAKAAKNYLWESHAPGTDLDVQYYELDNAVAALAPAKEPTK